MDQQFPNPRIMLHRTVDYLMFHITVNCVAY